MDKATQELAQHAFSLLSVHSFEELHTAYSELDQKLFVSKEWDPHKESLIINKVKSALLKIHPSQLDSIDRQWYNETLWLYHHHGISYALWKRDPSLARTYAEKAFSYQDDDHPNKITRLLWFLVQKKICSAKRWAKRIPPKLDRKLAFKLIGDYEQGRLF